jgi:hypothetical protein
VIGEGFFDVVKAERSEPKGSLDTEKNPSKIQKKLD